MYVYIWKETIMFKKKYKQLISQIYQQTKPIFAWTSLCLYMNMCLI